MPQRDPFSWAEDFANKAHNTARQRESDAQAALLTLFREEAGRQAPYVSLPRDLAYMNAGFQNQMMMDNQNFAQQIAMDDRNFGQQVALTGMRPSGKPIAANKMMQFVEQTASRAGRDPDLWLALVDIESSFNPQAVSSTGAKGLLQFTGGTANQFGLENPFDPSENMMAGMRLFDANAQYLEANGVPVTPGTIYLAHQQGAGGAVKLLRNPNARAVDVVGAQAVRVNGGNMSMTAGQFAKLWTDKMGRTYMRYKQAREARGAEKQNASAAALADLMKPVAPAPAPQSDVDIYEVEE